MAFVIWGQFLDHDLDLTEADNKENFDIPIPKNDSFFTNQQSLKFTRSEFIPSTSPRQHPNIITAWIDGSQIYGNDQETAKKLRTWKDGKLKTSSNGKLLYKKNGLFVSGDSRVNENLLLTSYHTIFVREHNRLCSEIKKKHSQLSDEVIFQAARHYIIGLLQKITFDDFLPILMGENSFRQLIGSYQGYNPNVSPNILT